MPNPGGYTNLALYDPATGTTVESALVTNVQDPVPERSWFTNGNGHRRILRESRMLAADLLDLTSVYQLRSWYDAETPVQFVLAGHTRCIQGYDSALLSSQEGPSPFGVNAPEHVELFTSEVGASWHTYVNLLQYNGWSTVAAGVPSGYTTGGTDYSASSSLDTATGIFTLVTTGGSDNARLYDDVIFPVEGATVTLSIEVTQDFTGTASTQQLLISARNFADAEIDSTAMAISGTGIKTVSHTLPADTYVVRAFVMDLQTVSGAGDIRFKYPRLRIDGVTSETRF